MNTPTTLVPAASMVAVEASTVNLTCSGVRLMVQTAKRTGALRSAATSALNAKRAGSLTGDLSVPTMTTASGCAASMASVYAATMSAREPALSSRAWRGQTPTDCSRVRPALLASSRMSVNVSLRHTAGRNTAVFLMDASAVTTPRATTLRPFAASGLMMVTLVRLTVSPIPSFICMGDCVVHTISNCNA